MNQEWRTSRLIVRAPRAGDGALLNAAICESLPELQAWMPWATPVPTVEESDAKSVEDAAKFEAGRDFSFRLWRHDGTFVGSCGLHPRNRQVPSFEIGYWCRTSFAGQGYITEAVREITRIGFEEFGARRLEIHCDALNLRSQRVAQACGFSLEGRLRHHDLSPQGELRDTLIFARLPI